MQNLSYQSLLRKYDDKYSSKFWITRKYEAYMLKKYYLNIREMPEHRWQKIYTDLNLLPISKTGKLCRRAEKVYQSMKDEIVDEFGVSEDYKKILLNLIRIEKYYGEIMRTGDRSKLFFIEVLEDKNKALRGTHTGVHLAELLLYFEQEGIKREYETITVFDFHHCSKFIEKRNAAKDKH